MSDVLPNLFKDTPEPRKETESERQRAIASYETDRPGCVQRPGNSKHRCSALQAFWQAKRVTAEAR